MSSLAMRLHQAHKERMARHAQAVKSYQQKCAGLKVEEAPEAVILTMPTPEAPVETAGTEPQWAAWYTPATPPEIITIQDVLRGVCRHYNITRATLISACRLQHQVNARQTAMYLVRRILMRSWTEIGRKLGDRDHTTCMHGNRCVERKMATDEAFRNEIETLERLIRAGAI